MIPLYQRDSFVVRRAAEGDLPDVLALEQQLYSSPWSEKAFRFELVNPRSLFWVFLEKDQLIGFQAGWTVLESYHLHNIALHSGWRGHGIAHEVVAFMQHYLARLAIHRIELEVRASNLRALAFYRRCGFTVDGIRRRYYQEPVEDAILMQNLI